MKTILLLVGIICSMSLVSMSLAHATSSLDSLDESLKLINQNTRTIERITDFTEQCTARVNSDSSVLPICDSLFQKFNVEVGKFYVENQDNVEELIYPYTLPSSIHTFFGQDSANVTGSNDKDTVMDHTVISMGYMETIGKASNECGSRVTSSDLSEIRSCISLMESLNSYLKVFNENARSEFDTMLDNPSTSTFGGNDYSFSGERAFP